ALRLDLRVKGDGVLDAWTAAALERNREAEAVQRLELLPVGGRKVARLHHDFITGGDQGTVRGDLGIELAQSAGGGVPWVGEGVVAPLCDPAVERLKVGQPHVDFAADHQMRRRTGLGSQLQRDGPQGPEVDRHVLAGGAVAPRGAPDEAAVLVDQLYRQAVVLGFDRV